MARARSTAPTKRRSRAPLVPAPQLPNDAAASLRDADFRMLAGIVDTHLGIKMSPTKKTMVATRLIRRLRALGMSSYDEYCDHLRLPEGAQTELSHLSDLITTHKTDFFREADQFDVLTSHVVPDLERRSSAAPSAWSAGCSSGEEVYTIAMVLADQAETRGRPASFFVRGTDVSEACVEKAKRGVYRRGEIEGIPESFRQRFLLRSVDRSAELFRIVPRLRATVAFSCLNFMDESWPADKFDVVFCRNVLIYFSEERRLAILGRLCKHIKPHGYLFLGHSETVHGLKLPIRPFARAAYQKT